MKYPKTKVWRPRKAPLGHEAEFGYFWPPDLGPHDYCVSCPVCNHWLYGPGYCSQHIQCPVCGWKFGETYHKREGADDLWTNLEQAHQRLISILSGQGTFPGESLAQAAQDYHQARKAYYASQGEEPSE